MGLLENWYPELALFENDFEASGALETARRRCGRAFWLVAIAAAAASYWFLSTPVNRVVSYVCEVVLKTQGPDRDLVESLLGLILAAVITLAAFCLWRRRIRRHLRELLRERHVPICLSCGYLLYELPEPRCPECGQAFEPELLTWRRLERFAE